MFATKLFDDGDGGSRSDQRFASTLFVGFAPKLIDDDNGGSRSDRSSSTMVKGFTPKLLDNGDGGSELDRGFASKIVDEDEVVTVGDCYSCV